MSGMVFRYFFFVLSFLVLWLQPSDFGNYKSFFITFFTFIGSWWIDKIAATVDGVKAYRKLLESTATSSGSTLWKDKIEKHVKACGSKLTTFFVALNALIMTVSIMIGSFLFVLTITGIMNFVQIKPERIDEEEILYVVVCVENDAISEEDSTTGSYKMQKYLFENVKCDVKRIFILSATCAILELIYLLIYACFSEFYLKLNKE